MHTFSVSCQPHKGLPSEATARVRLGDFDQVPRGLYLVNHGDTYRVAVGRFNTHDQPWIVGMKVQPQHAMQFLDGGFDIIMAEDWPGNVMGRVAYLAWDCML